MWFFKKKKETEQDMQVKRIKAEQLDMQGLFFQYKQTCRN